MQRQPQAKYFHFCDVHKIIISTRSIECLTAERQRRKKGKRNLTKTIKVKTNRQIASEKSQRNERAEHATNDRSETKMDTYRDLENPGKKDVYNKIDFNKS